MNGITTIIFDAGGVLLYIRRRRNEIVSNILLSMGYEEQRIMEALKAGEAFDKQYFTKSPWIYNWKEEKEWLLGHYTSIAKSIDGEAADLSDKLFMLTFDTQEYKLYPETVEILEQLKGEYQLGIISNALPSLDWAFDHLGIRRYFDYIIISAYEGVEKPDTRIYLAGAKKLGCKLETCIFIDDKIENVKAAEELGMKGFWLDRDKHTLYNFLEILQKK